MIELDGNTFTVQTPTEAAYDAVNYINQYCADNNILNSKGELIQIEINPTSPLFMILFGFGYLISILQRLVYSAACSMSLSASSDRQLLNLAQIANIKRTAASKTTFNATIRARTYSGVVPEGVDTVCHITTDLQSTIQVGTEQVVFKPAYSVDIAQGTAQNVVMVATTYGAYPISAGTIEGFDTTVNNLYSFYQNTSVPGQEEETIQSLRSRLINRTKVGTAIDRAMDAINALDGVSMSNIYFNNNASETIDVSGIQLPPRTAILVVQGYSDRIADTFYKYLNCLTTRAGTEDYIMQEYITKAQQHIPVYILPPQRIPLAIRIYINNIVPDSVKKDAKDALLTLSASMRIGDPVTVKQVIDCVSDIQGLSVVNAEVGTWTTRETSSGTVKDYEWSFMLTPTQIQLPELSYSEITFEEVGA